MSPSAPNPSVQSQIIAAAVAALEENTSWPAYRTRMAAFTDAQLPAYNVIPDESDPDYSETYTAGVDWKFRFKVRCTVTAESQVDEAADPLFVAGSNAILTDPTILGLVTSIRFAGVKWEREGQGEKDACAQVIQFECQFTAAYNDPSNKLP